MYFSKDASAPKMSYDQGVVGIVVFQMQDPKGHARVLVRFVTGGQGVVVRVGMDHRRLSI